MLKLAKLALQDRSIMSSAVESRNLGWLCCTLQASPQITLVLRPVMCLGALMLLVTSGCDSQSKLPQDAARPESAELGTASAANASPAIAPVEPTWAEAVEAVRRGESVEIRLQRVPVEDAQLADLAGLTKLQRLNLPHSRIDDAGLERIVREVPRLELLRLGSPAITDQGLATIAKLKNLRFLHLIDVPITDAGLKHIEPMTWLESLYLDGGQATDAGLSALIAALPELHFHRDQQHLPGDPHRDKH
jgi:hypothetical protein